MYDATTLKPHIFVGETQVECPVRGCSQKVARQRRDFKRASRFQCPEHQIYISPSTFEYPTELDNLLWKDEQDIALLESIRTVKRESRMARERSEDALSWNMFRHLEKRGILSAILSCIAGRDSGGLQLVYWSYSPSFHSVWPELRMARKEFGEQPRRGSEPDFIAFNDRIILLIEAKFTANNATIPSEPENRKKYVTGGGGWYHQVFASDYDTVANDAQKYELLRYWLLGSWIATQSGRDFALVNLVRSDYEQDIEKLFDNHIKADAHRHFVRVTWEEVFQRIGEESPPSAEKDTLLDYAEYKTAGYNRLGELERAFSIRKESIPGTDSGCQGLVPGVDGAGQAHVI